MTARETTRGTSASGAAAECQPECHISASDATLYLSAAPHLRRGMLRQKIIKSGESSALPPRPVGRTYAIRVLYGVEGTVPMSAVDTGKVRRQCRIALLQTMIRDILAIAVVVASALLEPLGTAIVFGLAVAVIILVGRVPLFSLWTAAAVIAVVFVLFMGIDRRQVSFAIPLVCLGVCFVVFLADTILSVHYLRKLWHMSSAPQIPQSGDPAPGGRSADATENSKDDQSPSQQGLQVSGPARIYHDSTRIIGSGAVLDPLPFTVSLEKPLDANKKIATFRTSDLVAHICLLLTSQGVSGTPENGYAHGILPEGRSGQRPQESPFTHGLPYLHVGQVISVPVPKTRKHPILRFGMLGLDYKYQPSEEEMRYAVDRPQIGQNERCYVCAITSSWRGQIVITVYFYAAMEAHSLSVTIKPYVLTPITAELRVAEDLAEQNPFLAAGKVVKMTGRQFLAAAQGVNRPRVPGRDEADMPGLYSVREHYADNLAENTHQRDDAIRIIRVLEAKIVRVTMKFLRDHNIDPNEDEQRAMQSVSSYTFTGDIISAGPGSRVNTAKGDNNTQTNN